MLILARLTFRRKSKVFEERAWGDMQTCKKGYRGGKVCIPTKRGNTQQHPNIPNIPNIPSQRNFEIFGFLKTKNLRKMQSGAEQTIQRCPPLGKNVNKGFPCEGGNHLER